MDTVEKEKIAKAVSFWIAKKLDTNTLALHEAAEIGFACLNLLDTAQTGAAFTALIREQDSVPLLKQHAEELSRSILA